MANLTFESAVDTIVSMKGEIIQALGETFYYGRPIDYFCRYLRTVWAYCCL